jgi:DNA-binding NarL/FixJ family response regulator
MTALMRTYLERLARGERPGRGPLTPREADVAKLIAEGNTAHQIAACLTISPKTVERHRANILEKLNLRDRVDLTRYAVRVGLIEP